MHTASEKDGNNRCVLTISVPNQNHDDSADGRKEKNSPPPPERDQRRPEKALGKAVETPDNKHLVRIPTERNTKVHQDSQAQSEENEFFRRNVVPQNAAYQLTCAVGNKTSGECHGELAFGKAG